MSGCVYHSYSEATRRAHEVHYSKVIDRELHYDVLTLVSLVDLSIFTHDSSSPPFLLYATALMIVPTTPHTKRGQGWSQSASAASSIKTSLPPNSIYVKEATALAMHKHLNLSVPV